MSDAEVKTINKISEETQNEIKNKTAFVLPDNPSAAGWKPGAIKQKLFGGLVDTECSIIAEINSIVEQANSAIKTLIDLADDEAETRENADKDLTTQISVEAETRSENDTKIENKLNSLINNLAISYTHGTNELTFKTVDEAGHIKETTIDLQLEKSIIDVIDEFDEETKQWKIKFVYEKNSDGKILAASSFYSLDKIMNLSNYVTLDRWSDEIINIENSIDKKLDKATYDTDKGNTDTILQELEEHKVDKTTVSYKVYGTDASGNQTTYPISKNATGGVVVKRGDEGHITVPDNLPKVVLKLDGTPMVDLETGEFIMVDDEHVAINKAYLDKRMVDKIDKTTYDKDKTATDTALDAKVNATDVRYKVYGTDKDGNQSVYNVDATDTLTSQGFVVRRTVDGNVLVPEAQTNNKYATSKAYVDNKVAEVSAAITNTIALVNNQQTKAVDIIPYLYDTENLSFVETIIRNSLLLDIQHSNYFIFSEYYNPSIGYRIKLIPRKPLAWDMPTECTIISFEKLNVDGFMDAQMSITKCVATLNSSDCSISLRLISPDGGYVTEEWWDDDLGDLVQEDYIVEDELDFNVKIPDRSDDYINHYANATVVLNEEVSALLPTTYSLRGDMTDLELETLEMMNNNNTETAE